jgi:hypothetical protein
MNRRIRELAEQALFESDFDDEQNIKITMDIFAELIVRECMLCCERVISDPVPKSVDTWLNGGKQCIDEIKYHFGVEE